MQVDQNTLKQKIQQLQFKYYQVSAKTGRNIQKLLEQACSEVFKNQIKQNQRSTNIQVEDYFKLMQISSQKQNKQINLHVKHAEKDLPIDMSLVYTLFCSNCKQQLSTKEQNTMLKTKDDVVIFSSDLRTAKVVQKGQQRESQMCQCKIKALYCNICNYQCGYYITKPCKACRQSQIKYEFYMFWNSNIQAKIQEQIQLKHLQEQQQVNQFQEQLSENGISDLTIQILKNEQIQSFQQIAVLNDEVLKQVGLKLGQIARLREWQKIKYLIK